MVTYSGCGWADYDWSSNSLSPPWYFRLGASVHTTTTQNQFIFQNSHSIGESGHRWNAAKPPHLCAVECRGLTDRPVGPCILVMWLVVEQCSTDTDTVKMGKFSLTRLIMCAKYQRLSSEDYIRLGLCMPESCPDCVDGSGHYVKNDKMVRKIILQVCNLNSGSEKSKSLLLTFEPI